MSVEPNIQQVVFTNEARCRDCYRCVRVCPVKAIRVEHDQAFVDRDRCIGCGTCIRECPQAAKTYRRDVDKVEQVLSSSKFVAASIAPSFSGVFEEWEYSRLSAALRCLGFHYVAETAVGAYLVARDTVPLIRSIDKPCVCTACPAVVNYIEKYDQESVPRLLPLVSPMVAHARHIKTRYGRDAKVVFIGPCVAKKMEAERREFRGLIDVVLTFEELQDWFHARKIDLGHCEESVFDEQPAGRARLFPIEGGAMATASEATDVLGEGALFVSGFEEVKESLRMATTLKKPCVIEPLFCAHGCVNGPGVKGDRNVFERRAKVIAYAQKYAGISEVAAGVDLTTRFFPVPINGRGDVKEEQVRQVFEATGKANIEEQLNCGACGYAACRDQAIAAVQGMADRGMCIPYMRRLAEQRSDKIMEASPNGIVILGRDMNILNVNPAFERLFHAGACSLGKNISQFMDPDPFEKVISGEIEMFDDVRTHAETGLVLREIVYALRDEGQYVGMFISRTVGGVDEARLQKVKDETLQQAQELYAHQIEMAKDLANFLGRYTAKGEQLVHRLFDAVKDDDAFNEPGT